MMKSTLVWTLFIILWTFTLSSDVSNDVAEATEGGSASLPCNIAPEHTPDKVSAVLWYRGTSNTALYRYDLRGVRPQHWAEPSLGDRYFLRVLDDERAMLTLAPIRLSDEDVYHCQVEFTRSPMRVTHVNLTVIDDIPTDEQKPLILSANLNMALCYLKENNAFDAKTAASAVLAQNPKNEKAYFRRGQAYLAADDFTEVLKIEPNNKAAQAQLASCNKTLKEEVQKEKKIYANMFAKFAKMDAQVKTT